MSTVSTGSEGNHLVAGYGGEGAEMLAARFISERMDRFEPWLHQRGVKSSFFQRWMESQQWRAQNVLDAPPGALDGADDPHRRRSIG